LVDKLLLSGEQHHITELTIGQWVKGQMGQQIWMGHVGH